MRRGEGKQEASGHLERKRRGINLSGMKGRGRGWGLRIRSEGHQREQGVAGQKGAVGGCCIPGSPREVALAVGTPVILPPAPGKRTGQHWPWGQMGGEKKSGAAGNVWCPSHLAAQV